MPDLGPHAKAIVAAIMAILVVIDQVGGYSLGISEQYVTMLLTVLTPLFVWLTPNKAGS